MENILSIAKPSSPVALALWQAWRDMTEENWNKGSYFAPPKTTDGPMCACLHGRVQLQVNPEVKKALDAAAAVAAGTAVPTAAATTAAAAESTAAATYLAVSAEHLAVSAVTDAATISSIAVAVGEAQKQKINFLADWNNRPNYVRKNHSFNGKDYGSTDAHFVLGYVGGTVNFNDSPTTTFPMIQEKLRQAIELAVHHNI